MPPIKYPKSENFELFVMDKFLASMHPLLNMPITTYNEYISLSLNEKGIAHKTMNDDKSWEKESLIETTQQIKHMRSYLNPFETDMLMPIIFPWLSSYIYARKKFKSVLGKTKKKIFYYKSNDLLTAALEDELESKNIPHTSINTPPRNRIIRKMQYAVPYLGWERNYYPFPAFPKLLIREIPKNTEVIWGTFCFRTEINEYAPVMAKVKSCAIIHEKLPKREFEILSKLGIPWIYFSEKDMPAKIPEAFWKSLIPDSNWNRKYNRLVKTKCQNILSSCNGNRAWYKKILSHNNSKIFVCVGDANPYSRAGLHVAKSVGLTTISCSAQLDQLHFVQEKEIILHENIPPDYSFVSGKKIKKSLKHFVPQRENIEVIGSLKLKTNQKILPRATLLKKLNLPNNAKYILLTTQQHKATFEYAKIVAIAAKKAGYYLVIRPHPHEWRWLYRTMLPKYSWVRITKKGEIDDLIAQAEALITAYSFTAIESLCKNKPTLLLDFNTIPFRPKIFDHTIHIKNTYELSTQLQELEMIKPDFSKEEYFASGNAVEKFVQILNKLCNPSKN